MNEILELIKFFILESENNWLKPTKYTLEGLEKLSYTFSPEQKETVLKVLLDSSEKNLLITGKAGVGKTYLIKAITTILRLFDCNTLVVSSSGVASQNCEGATLCSTFRLGIHTVLPTFLAHDPNLDGCPIPSMSNHEKQVELKQTFGFKSSLVIIVDEVYSCSSEQLFLMVDAVKSIYKGFFKFIFLGDNGQLGPVESKNDKGQGYSSYPTTSAKFPCNGKVEEFKSILSTDTLYDRSIYQNVTYGPEWDLCKIVLIENQRQKDNSFADALNWIRGGNEISGPASILKECFTSKKGMPPDIYKALHLFAGRKEASNFNQNGLDEAKKNGNASKVYVGTIQLREKDKIQTAAQYIKGLNDVDADKKLNKLCDSIPLIQELAIGLPFMVRQNDNKLKVYNGTIGIIEQLGENHIVINVKGMLVHLDAIVITSVNTDKRNRPLAYEIKALPGQLALGMTGHKAQGLSIDYPCVVHLLGKVYWIKYVPGWVYVVLSRVTNQSLLYIEGNLSTINNIISCRPEVKEEQLKLEVPFIIGSESEVINFKAYFEDFVYFFDFNTSTKMYKDSEGEYAKTDFNFDERCTQLIKDLYTTN